MLWLENILLDGLPEFRAVEAWFKVQVTWTVRNKAQ